MEGEASAASALLRPPAPEAPPPPRRSRLSTLLGRASGRRGPSMLVRETAALQLQGRRTDWAFSRPVVALDIAWNLAFAVLSAAMLGVSTRERPNAPLRLWVVGYALQCVVHVALVWTEYRRRQGRRSIGTRRFGDGGAERLPSDSEAADSEDDADVNGDEIGNRSSFAKRCESLNTMASFIWWIVGFYWVVCGGETLLQKAPRLYWLTVVFLAFDVFFTIFCIALACIIGVALCCCLPCIIAILYALVGQEGASDSDISILPRYRYSETCHNEEKTTEDCLMIPVSDANGVSLNGRLLPREDAECCICLTPYEEGTELHSLPCNHHFHSACIVKWLLINASCPLCKYNILKGNDTM